MVSRPHIAGPNISQVLVIRKQILYFQTNLGETTELTAITTQPTRPRLGYKDDIFFFLWHPFPQYIFSYYILPKDGVNVSGTFQ
jgi:hypothetical protein